MFTLSNFVSADFFCSIYTFCSRMTLETDLADIMGSDCESADSETRRQAKAMLAEDEAQAKLREAKEETMRAKALAREALSS